MASGIERVVTADERKYSVDELELMRRWIDEVSWFHFGPQTVFERVQVVEEKLRTHMLAGTSVDELRAWHDRTMTRFREMLKR